jgi:hypothetical protein
MYRQRSISTIAGTPFLKELPKGKYWYARQRIGDSPIGRYIGPDSPALRERLVSAAKQISSLPSPFLQWLFIAADSWFRFRVRSATPFTS